MNFLRKYKIHILFSLLAFFLLSIVFQFGSSFFLKGSPNDTIVEVNGKNVPLHKYWSYYNRSVDASRPLDAAAQAQKRDEVIRDLVQSVIFSNEIKRYKIHVPDTQVAVSLTQIPQFQTEGRFDPNRYMQLVRSQLRTTPQEFEEDQRMSIGFFKLRWLIQSVVKVTNQELQMAEGYPEFAKANLLDGKRKRTESEIQEMFRAKVWNDKVMFSFNQWLAQLGKDLNVKTHLDVLEGQAKS
jgi:peptidyl-prolyl cis-trans isomerase D